MPSKLKIGVSQSHTLGTLQATLSALRETTQQAAQKGIFVSEVTRGWDKVQTRLSHVWESL